LKCPYCSKEIKDDALFCGFCGKKITQIPATDASPPSLPEEMTPEVPETSHNIPPENIEQPQKKKPQDTPQKKSVALKVLLIFVLLAFISGSILGFLSARDIIPLTQWMSRNNIHWTSFAEGHSETVETDAAAEDNSESKKDDLSETSAATEEEAETSPSTEPADSPSETTVPDETQQSVQDDFPYAYIGNSLVLVDDMAHIWDETTIADILANAKAMSQLSGYSIMIVTNDIFDMTSQEFAETYYNHVITLGLEGNEAHLLADGYLFLINPADREYYLSTHGKAAQVYTTTVMNDIFNAIQQFVVEENYAAAVNKVIEKTIYEN